MAAGDPYFDCDNQNLPFEAALRGMIYNDGNGNPVINLSQDGSTLEPWFTCENSTMSTAEVLRRLVVQDTYGNPVLNVATS